MVYAQSFDRALQDIRVDVIYLASDDLEGREPGTNGEMLAAQYIASRFEELGLKPYAVDDKWFQSFEFTYSNNPHTGEGRKVEAKNVIGYIDNEASTTVIIGAHYDHLGYGEFGSRYVGDKAIYNGADDNASGVAGLIRLAELLTQSDAKNNNYVFVAFSAEEMGLFGSKHFVQSATIDLSEINYMLNMDMIGRLNDERTLVINGVGTSPVWEEVLPAIDVADIQIKTTKSGVGPSDHTSFYLKDIPVLHFFSGQHTDYHKPIDDSHLINYEGIQAITDYTLTLIEKLDGEGKIAFTATKDESQGRQISRFKVSLGVMPDYVFQGEGMRVDAVLEDRPAAKGGVEDGDIIVKIGEWEVTDIYTYMDALSKYESGDTAILHIKRGEEILEKEITF